MLEWSGGEFFDPAAPHSIPREIAQKQFLLLASELYGVTADLRDNVLPNYRRQEHESAISALRLWQNRYGLNAPWILDQVRKTLDLWTLFPRVAKLDRPNPPWHPLFHLLIRRPRPATTTPFGFTYDAPYFEITAEGVKEWREAAGWDVELERKEKFIAEAAKQFQVALKAYCVDQERKAKERGFIKVKRPRALWISFAAKVKWTVQRRCARMKFEQIASAHLNSTGQDVDVSTIIKATNEICKLIELKATLP